MVYREANKHIELIHSRTTDGSFIMANSNSFFESPWNNSIAQENKYLGKVSYHEIVCYVYSLESPYFIMKLYVVCTH